MSVVPELELLGSASSREPTGARAARWSEVSIYRAGTGYLVEECGRSTLPNEQTLTRQTPAANAREAITNLTASTGGRLTRVAQQAIAAAAVADSNFSASLGDALEVEDLQQLEQPAGEEFIFPRRGKRALRFRARRIGLGSSLSKFKDNGGYRNGNDRGRWTEYQIFRAGDTLVAAQILRAISFDGAVQSDVVITKDPAEIIRAFTRSGRGWADEALLNAFHEAAAADPGVADAIAGDDLETWAHGILGPDELPAGSMRHAIVAAIDEGAKIVTRDGPSGGILIEDAAGIDLPPRALGGVLIDLARRRFAVPERQSNGSFIWALTPRKGPEALQRANDELAQPSAKTRAITRFRRVLYAASEYRARRDA